MRPDPSHRRSRTATEPPTSSAPRWLLAIASTAVLTSIITGVTVAGAVHGFSDVPDDHPFHDDIGWLSHLGITEGYPDGTYRPADPVTRGSMAAFLRRLHDIDDTSYVASEAAGATTVSGDDWTLLPGSLLEFEIPRGTEVQLLATFSAESQCTGSSGYCRARIMVDDPSTGAQPPFELETGSAGFAFDSTDGGSAVAGSWASHSMQRHARLIDSAGDSWTAWVELNTNAESIDLRVDDWTLSLLVDVQGADI